MSAGVATSLQSHELAKEAGIPLVNLDAVTELDITIDGADQYSEEEPTVIKGGGGAHAREKVVDAMADQLVIATDEEKATDPLDFPVPVEVMPDAREVVSKDIREVGGEPELRMAVKKDGPVFTANGNLVLDVDFGGLDDTAGTARDLEKIPGDPRTRYLPRHGRYRLPRHRGRRRRPRILKHSFEFFWRRPDSAGSAPWSLARRDSLEERPKFGVCRLVLVEEHVVTGIGNVDEPAIAEAFRDVEVRPPLLDTEVAPEY